MMDWEGGRQARGTRAGAKIEGVGEHVRIRSHIGSRTAGEIADRKRDLHRTKKSCFFCRTAPGARPLASSIRPLT